MKPDKLFWDCTIHFSEYPNIIKSIFKKYYLKERNNFVNWMELISVEYKDDIDWWSSPPASRNLYYSNLYKNICILKTISSFQKYRKIKLYIRVDSINLKKIIIKNFKKEFVEVEYFANKKKKLHLVNHIKISIYFVTQFCLLKFLSLFKNYKYNTINIIDTFVINSETKEKYYYGKLRNYLNKNLTKTFFIPTIIENNFFKFFKISFSLFKDKNFLFKEIYTKIDDIFFCILYILRKKKFDKRFVKFQNYNLSSLINEEINQNNDLYTVFISIYNYRFAKKISLGSVKIKKIVNWFENQSIDKGWNFGFRKFYPKLKTIGYQGFTSQPEYMYTLPTLYEKKYKIIPDQIVTVGKNFINIKKEFCRSLDIVSGPALRFDDLFISSKRLKKNFKIVLFLEGASEKNDKELILKFIEISKQFPKLTFYIKQHPSLILKKNLKLPNNFVLLGNKFSFIAKRTLIAVAYGNTSVTLESLAYGCKLLVPIDNFFDRLNLKKLNIPNNLYRVCSNQNDIFNAINFFLNKKNKKNYNKVVLRNKLFNKVTSKNVKVLI